MTNSPPTERLRSLLAERALIWKTRKAAFAAMGRIAPAYYIQDGVIPRTRLSEVLGKIDTKMVDQAVFLWIVHDVWPIALSPRVKGFVHPQSWYVDFSPVTVE